MPQPQPMGYPVGYAPAGLADPRLPAKRASVLMFILGGAGVGCGVCVGAVSQMPLQQLAAQNNTKLPPFPPGMTLDLVMKAMVFMAVASLVASLMQLAAAVFVRRGSAAACAFGMVLSVVFILYFAVETLSSFSVGQAGVVFISLPAAVAFIVQLILLINARRASGQIAQMQAAYQARYWHYLQQQQVYQTGAYNQNPYHAPAAPAPSAPSQTGWQMPAPPPPPPTSSGQPPAGGGGNV